MDIREVLVIAHTRCRLLGGTNEAVRKKISDRGNVDANKIDSHPFPDLEEGVRTGCAGSRSRRCYLPRSW